MSRNTWISNPTGLKQSCHCAVLPSTLKGLKALAQKYKKSSKLKWHNVQFQYISVMARVLQVNPNLVITDNTAILVDETLQSTVDKDIFLNSFYYRFYYELTPYMSNFLRIIKVEKATSAEVWQHMMSTITEELYASVHQTLVNKAKENDDQNKEINQVREIVRSMDEFTAKTIKQITKLPDQVIQTVLSQLCQNGEIGDFGEKYIVVKIAEPQEKMKEEKSTAVEKTDIKRKSNYVEKFDDSQNP